MSRPRKNKAAPLDKRADYELSLFHQIEIDRARVDPFNDEPLACVLAPVILDRATESEREFVGELFASVLATGTPEQIKGFFARVARLTANAEQPHRNSLAYFGYARFVEETGREPSKPELKAYLLARPETFKGLPANDAKSEWTDLWKACGLSGLANRKVGKKT